MKFNYVILQIKNMFSAKIRFGGFAGLLAGGGDPKVYKKQKNQHGNSVFCVSTKW
ncbi:hypothetical protein [Desulfovibrio sp.]|uniref:hypothetical protein n=1 Tax=Desulfovibrio sp. TaxID=885 RepID=UPI0025B83A67|nr:hypothetical protein [Desulfovibrio sp.]